MRCKNFDACVKHINFYLRTENAVAPLIVNAQNFDDYHLLVEKLHEANISFIHLSDYSDADNLPKLENLFKDMSRNGNFAILGLSQFFMLQGEQEIEKLIAELLNFRHIEGHAVILTLLCEDYLKKYTLINKRAENWTILLEGSKAHLPELVFVKYQEFAEGLFCENLQKFLRSLEAFPRECGNFNKLTLQTKLPHALFTNSIFPIRFVSSPYDEAVKKFPELILHKIGQGLGTEEQWLYLFRLSLKYADFSELVSNRFGPPDNFSMIMPVIFSQCPNREKWLFWLSLKLTYVGKNDYIEFALNGTQSYSQFIHNLYCVIFKVPIRDARFMNFYSERRTIIQNLPEDFSEQEEIVNCARNLGQFAVYYLTDYCEEEEYEFLKLISEHEFSDSQLYEAAKHSFPELSFYMHDFTFDEVNTVLRDKDANFREVLKKYFHDYKLQKIRNKLNAEFLSGIEVLAAEKTFYKLQPRSSLLYKFKAEKTQTYFFDALGVEYLGYIQVKCEEYGMNCEVKICRCNLPSTTYYNKEFANDFSVKSISALDDVKHHGVKFNYSTCEYPLHIFHELRIIDRELRKISAEFSRAKIDRALIVSDHGASRLVTLHNHEKIHRAKLPKCASVHTRFASIPQSQDSLSMNLRNSQKFRHAVFGSGFMVIADYSVTRGSSLMACETHGGASLEETIIPIIILTKKD